MRVRIEKSRAKGRIKAPPSKSFAHRLIIAAGLSEGKSVISSVSKSEDILATLDCIKALTNAEICERESENSLEIEISGGKIGGKRSENEALAENHGAGDKPLELYCRESGSTLRFFIPIALADGRETVFHGSERLIKRPMSVYEDICLEKGLTFENDGEKIRVKGPLQAGRFKVRGDISSQFITGLLFALPTLEGDSEIEIIPPIDSRPYIDITLEVLRSFGVFAEWQGDNKIFVKGNSKYKEVNCEVEGDFSNAAFLSAFNYLGGDVEVTGLREDSPQGDKIYREYFEKINLTHPTLDINDCPDLAPVLMALAAAKNGVTLTGTRRLKIKESDRGVRVAEELLKFGIKTELCENSLTVFQGELKKPSEILSGHNDHRIVMSLSLLTSLVGGEIEGAEAVAKSYPDYFEAIKQLGIEVKVNDN